MVRRVAREGSSFDFLRSSLLTRPAGGEWRLIHSSIRSPFDTYVLPSPSIFVHGSFLPVNKDRFGIRGDRLLPSLPFRFFPDTSTPLRLPLHKLRDTSALFRLVELHCIYGHKLSLTATLSLTPPPPSAPTVAARFRFAVNPKPPLAFPTRKARHPHYALQSEQAAIRHHPPTR